MRKDEMHVLDYLMEAMTVIALVIYIVLQIIYLNTYGISVAAILNRIVVYLLIYAALLVAQFWPELINIGSSEPLKGKVRLLAVRMLRIAKWIIAMVLLIPGIADMVDWHVDEIWSILAAVLLLIDVIWHMYKIYRCNKDNNE